MIVSNYRRMYVTVDTADGTAYLSALYRSDWIYNLLGKLHHFRIWWSHRTSSNGFILYDHFQGGEMQLLIPSQLGETERVTWDSSGASCRVYSLKIHGHPATMNIVSQDTYRWGLIRCQLPGLPTKTQRPSVPLLGRRGLKLAAPNIVTQNTDALWCFFCKVTQTLSRKYPTPHCFHLPKVQINRSI